MQAILHVCQFTDSQIFKAYRLTWRRPTRDSNEVTFVDDGPPFILICNEAALRAFVKHLQSFIEENKAVDETFFADVSPPD